MNKQELIEQIEGLKNIFWNECEYVKIDFMIELVSELDEPEAGHADEAPRYVKNILARLRELPLHDREVWLKAIMGEFERDFSRAKWREGYEQGKLEGAMEREKPVVKQFVADWYEKHKNNIDFEIWHYLHTFSSQEEDEFKKWMNKLGEKQIQTLVNMHQFGYEIEKEKRYRVKMKGMNKEFTMLKSDEIRGSWFLGSVTEYSYTKAKHTRKELEQAGFGWVFDCPGIEIEEVE